MSFVNNGYNYRLPMPGAVIEGGMLKANVELPGLAIHYTTDGSEPTTKSPVYEAPVKAAGTIKLKSFDMAGKGSRTSIVTAQ